MAQERPLIRLLIEVVDGIDINGAVFDSYLGNWYSEPALEYEGQLVSFNVPNEDDVAGIEEGLSLKVRNYYWDEDQTQVVLNLIGLAQKVQKEFNSRIAGKVEEAKAKRDAERLELERVKAARQEALDAREQRLLTEFLGERGRIRVFRSTTYQPVTVTAIEQYGSEGEYKVDFEWVNDHDYGRQKKLDKIMAFDIKVGSRYHCVWG